MEWVLEIVAGLCVAGVGGLALLVIHSRIAIKVLETQLRSYEAAHLVMASDLGALRAEVGTLVAETREANRRYEDLAGGLRQTVTELEARYFGANQIYIDAIATVNHHSQQLETMAGRMDSVRADMVRYLGEREG